jgi:hypothetical protein
MTNEQINIAIAEVLGRDFDPAEARNWGSRGRWVKHDNVEGGQLVFKHSIPDYCNDLNAMHEAEDKLEGMNKVEFAIQLCRVVGKDWPSGIGGGSFAHIHATALQKVEAFLRTIGKWEEGGK